MLLAQLSGRERVGRDYGLHIAREEMVNLLCSDALNDTGCIAFALDLFRLTAMSDVCWCLVLVDGDAWVISEEETALLARE